MVIIRNVITTSIAAAALCASAVTGFAMSPAAGYGRAGGAAWATQGLVESNGPDTSSTQASPMNLYGRAGGMTGSEKVGYEGNRSAATEQGAVMPNVPGRQGHVLTIDELRG